ncbi:transmembrane protein, putative (macronuclear) [Tetrahymena thermophila SB210]|uniref:Transmembrane protein, putative n=1 Tax=Tetrahymena thermophila (strain SB210) TaxID=312017 RepID=W7XC92_TETTS|nr:transmembrane protein, putative [Tetrahymena thermophila SB210]EWS74148.1 transmembrane protein, putative [Tetrahymena thermophila SB210]|eukprot:XP_012653318.1 transmembrane protein, putative [Tetrahymena thermophila SB210]
MLQQKQQFYNIEEIIINLFFNNTLQIQFYKQKNFQTLHFNLIRLSILLYDIFYLLILFIINYKLFFQYNFQIIHIKYYFSKRNSQLFTLIHQFLLILLFFQLFYLIFYFQFLF